MTPSLVTAIVDAHTLFARDSRSRGPREPDRPNRKRERERDAAELSALDRERSTLPH